MESNSNRTIDGSSPLPSAQSEQFFQHLLETAPDAILIIDSRGRVVLANTMVERQFEYDSSQLIGQFFDLLLPDRLRFRSPEERQDALKDRNQLRLHGKTRLNREFPIEISVSHLNTRQGLYYTVVIRDVSERTRMYKRLQLLADELQRANDKLLQLANLDPLTEVLNRRGLAQSLNQVMHASRQEGSPTTVVLIDLDNFKAVNDTRGHLVGDLVLKAVVERVQSALRQYDILARAGGDEFIVIMPSTSISDGATVAERMRKKVAESALPVVPEGINITISCGVANLPRNLSTLDEILQLTRASLKLSKASGKNRISISGEGHLASSVTGIGDQTYALDELTAVQEFNAVAQPIFNLESRQIVGYELLVRGPSKALLMPAQLFSAARQADLLNMVDLTCLTSCLKKGALLPPEIPLHVNILPSTLLDTPIETLIGKLHALQERQICLEISEQRLTVEPSYLQEPLRQLREASSVKLAIDDVCFGRSSLEALILLEPDMCKLDVEYVSGVSTDTRKQRAIRRLHNIASALNIEIIAEGVENEADLCTLQELGITTGQGFLLGQPEPLSLRT